MKLAGAYIHDDKYTALVALAAKKNRTLAGQCRHIFDQALREDSSTPEEPQIITPPKPSSKGNTSLSAEAAQPHTPVSSDALAINFGTRLRANLSLKLLQEVIELNTRELNSSICHSHDFIDANEVMNEAWLLTYPDTPFDLHNDTHCQLWASAWSLAKHQQFGVSLPAT